jgi:glycosyltransferase involved in cell wall biosynthesis
VSTDALVTVIIPTRNRAALLARAIRSVQQQTYSNFEIIVIDDASGDDTRETVERLGDSRIRYIRHETNRGGSAARNTGISAATGEFIAFLDDDDQWESEKTDTQVDILQDCDAVLCTSDQLRDRLAEFDHNSFVSLDDLRRGRFTAGGTSILMAKTNILQEIMFDETLPRYQDWDLFIRIAMRHRIRYLNKPLVRYNKGAHERITNRYRGLPMSEIERQLRMFEKHRAFFGTKWFRRHMCRAMLSGIKGRRDRMGVVVYVVRRYGLMGVVRAMGLRARSAFRKGFPVTIRGNEV